MPLNILSLRTKLSEFNLKWNNLPNISEFTQQPILIYPENCFNNKNNNHNNDLVEEKGKSNINLGKCRIVGYIPTNNIKYCLHPKSYNLYLIYDAQCLYLCLGLSLPIWWYSIIIESDVIDIKQLSTLINQYDAPDNLKYDYRDFAILGNTRKMIHSIGHIEHDIITSNLTELLSWGSFYSKYPYDKDMFFCASGKDKINYISEAMKQLPDNYSMSFTTLYSKSVIKVIHYQKFINIQIQYKAVNYEHPIITYFNETHDRSYPEDLPIDVIMILKSYPYLNYRDVVESNEDIDEIIPFLGAMIPKIDRDVFYYQMQLFYPEEIIHYLQNKLK